MRGRQITIRDVVIAKLSGLPAKGPVSADKGLRLHGTMETFRDEGQELIKKGKCIRPSSLKTPWGELA